MNKTIVAIVFIVVGGAVSSVYLWSSFHRYQAVTGTNGAAYQIDTHTGNSWMLYGNLKVPQVDNTNSTVKDEELPNSAMRKVTGNAAISFGELSGKLYNGSVWTLTRAIIGVTAKEKDGSIRWTRDFSVSVTVPTLTTRSFSVSLTGVEGVSHTSWSIKKVYGYRE